MASFDQKLCRDLVVKDPRMTLIDLRSPNDTVDTVSETDNDLTQSTNVRVNQQNGTTVLYNFANSTRVNVAPLDEENYYEILTSRNQMIISPKVQQNIRNTQFVVFGVGSTGGDIAVILAQFGATKITIADLDVLDGSNLNRQHGSYYSIGRHKTEIIADVIYDINPYVDLKIYSERIVPEKASEILAQCANQGKTIVFSELDDKDVIIEIHKIAHERRIAAICATDIGHACHLAIFRYDLGESIFAGRLSLEDARGMSLMALMAKFIKISEIPKEYITAVLAMMKGTIDFIPQVATASKKSAAVAMEAVIGIFEGKKLRTFAMHDTCNQQLRWSSRVTDLPLRIQGLIALLTEKRRLLKTSSKANGLVTPK